MTVSKRMVPVIEVGTIPSDVVVVEPGRATFSLETLAKAAFGLGIEMDALIMFM